MKISVAVPSFNYAIYLNQCLNSIRNQSYKNFEVLIADGGSNDGSLEVINQFCKEDSRFRLVSTKDNGQADAIKIAFSQATGEILCFLNADDCYLDDQVFIRVVNDFKKKPEISVLTYGGYYIDANDKKIKKINYRYHPLDGFHWMRYRPAIIQPATFWLTKVYDPVKWPSQFHFVFDVVFFYAAYLNFKWYESPVPVAGYRLHGDNKSMSVKSKRIRELASFEEIKFGSDSYRPRYLRSIAAFIEKVEALFGSGSKLSKIVYIIVNIFAFLSFYRLPSI